jgi:hypothetical protein
MSGRTKFVVLPILLTALAGCGDSAGGPGVATAASGPSTVAASTAAAKPDAVKFRACLQQHGVDVDALEQAGTPDLPKEAVEKCRQFLPGSGTLEPLSAEELGKVRAYAKCMRGNGVPDFPDPNAAGDFGADWDGTKIIGTEAGEKANAVCSKDMLTEESSPESSQTE